MTISAVEPLFTPEEKHSGSMIASSDEATTCPNDASGRAETSKDPVDARFERGRSGVGYRSRAFETGPMPAVSTNVSKKKYKSFPQYRLSQIPILIPTFENPTYTCNMVNQLRERDLQNIIIIDNCSTSQEMLDLLDDLRSVLVVIDLPENAGPHYVFRCAETYCCLPELFCITDPDLEFNIEMPDDFLHQMLFISNQMRSGKVGLALSITDHADFLPTTITMAGRPYSILEWESQFWTNCAGHLADGTLVFRADVDTTFALYNKNFFSVESIYSAYRVAGRYTCRHLPWYASNKLPERELQIYRAREKHSFYLKSP